MILPPNIETTREPLGPPYAHFGVTERTITLLPPNRSAGFWFVELDACVLLSTYANDRYLIPKPGAADAIARIHTQLTATPYNLDQFDGLTRCEVLMIETRDAGPLAWDPADHGFHTDWPAAAPDHGICADVPAPDLGAGLVAARRPDRALLLVPEFPSRRLCETLAALHAHTRTFDEVWDVYVDWTDPYYCLIPNQTADHPRAAHS